MSTIAQAAMQSNDIILNGKVFTNNTKLSKEHAIFAAYHSTLYSGNPPREGKLSTTTIIGSVKQALMAIKYSSEETGPEEVSNLIASAKGTAMHNGLTAALQAYDPNYTCEKRIEREVEDWKISGEFDVLTPDKQIKDFKFVSNYNIKKLIEDKQALQPEWTLEDMYTKAPTYFKYVAQLSIYRYLLNDPEVKMYGSILFSLNNGSDMGKYTIDQEVTFPLRPMEEVHEFLVDRVKQIKAHIAAGTIPPCSDVERGYTPGEWKLSRVGSTGKEQTVRGSKCNSAAELSDFIRLNGRPGDKPIIIPPKYALCGYCKFKTVCDQYIPPVED